MDKGYTSGQQRPCNSRRGYTLQTLGGLNCIGTRLQKGAKIDTAKKRQQLVTSLVRERPYQHTQIN